MAGKPSKGQDAPLPFPLAGLDSSDPHDKQRPLTTRDAENVRSFDVLENRARGGSRSGLTLLITDTVTGDPGNPIQHLNVLVDPTPEAVLDDDGQNGGNPGGFSDGAGPNATPGPGEDLIDDTSTGNRRPRKPPGGRKIRNRGSGVRPTRNGKQKLVAPVAVDDTFGMAVGDPQASIQILGNDSFSGEPSWNFIKPLPGMVNGSKLGTAGKGTGKRVTFLPPQSGSSDYTFTIPYRLTAKGNKGSSTATLTINVTGGAPPGPCVLTTVTINATRPSDGTIVAVREGGPWCSCDKIGTIPMQIAPSDDGSVDIQVPSGTIVGNPQAIWVAYWDDNGGYDAETNGVMGAPTYLTGNECTGN